MSVAACTAAFGVPMREFYDLEKEVHRDVKT
jgi:hypothetical protein